MSLEIAISNEEIINKNPELKDKLSVPKWNKIHDYYGFDIMENKVLFADNQGYVYAIDSENIKAEKITKDIKITSFSFIRYFTNSAKFKDERLSMEGKIRSYIEYDSENINPDISYLEAEFILDNNRERILKKLKARFENDNKQLKQHQFRFDSIIVINGDEYWTYDDYTDSLYDILKEQIHDLENKMRNYKRDLENIEEGDLHIVERLLQTDSTSFFVKYKSSTEKDARLIIAFLELKNKTKLTEKWNIQLENVFFDYNEANETNDFKTVFSKGNPTFDFQYFNLIDDKLIIIYMLHAFSIDTSTGEVIWSLQL